MLIGKDYKVESDSLNVSLYERRVSKKTQEEYWVAIKHFSSFGNALKALVDMKVKETKLGDFRAVCERQDALYELIDDLKISSKGVNQ